MTQEGANMEMPATRAPSTPAAFRPISTTISAPGPGVAREMANRSRNCRAVSQ